ncbi:Transcriptional regulator, DeoR family [hydrothermal vent metagenome]|uniref:Transcriptional regulator, DeoR family n=1 Tax=hydrothermal vent metagenome TaxID=652676 RepID=A0A3B0UIC1_9ZZZZ
MLKRERQLEILSQLEESKKVLSTELSLSLNVSEDTIRRDLKELANEGKLLKVHGGALTTAQKVYAFRENEIFDHDKKLIMAKKALTLIEDNDVLIIGGGTTNMELVSIFPPDLGITVFTYSLPVAMRLSDHPKIDVILFGGKLMKSAQVTVGLDMIQNISNMRADACFLSTSGIDIDTGLMEIDWEISQLKKAIIRVCDKVVIMSTVEKIDSKQRFLVCGIDKINHLITESDSDLNLLQGFKKRGVQVL